MSATLIVGGESELAFFGTILAQCHACVDLTELGARIECARGDSRIPEIVHRYLAGGHKVIVLYDRDALARAHEQAAVISDRCAEFWELGADFEATFDPTVVQSALLALGYVADRECLSRARASGSTYSAIEDCARPVGPQPVPLTKVRLADAEASIATASWYVPLELYQMAIRWGELCGIGPWSDQAGWLDAAAKATPATGCLYAANHVVNDRVQFWDFDRAAPGVIPLPRSFDGDVTMCRGGGRLVLRTFERSHSGSLPAHTWIYVFDRDGSTLHQVAQFRVRGSVYGVEADEDGNHLKLSIQRDNDKHAVRCLADGTQQESIAVPEGDLRYAPKASRTGTLLASGPEPLAIQRLDQYIAVFPHFYAHSHIWSPCERFLAFFGRRWGRKVKSQDFLWIYDTDHERIHRVAISEKFLPAYWASAR